MLRRLSLRTRLILGVITLAALGLLAADIATYSSLSSFLSEQTDNGLNEAHGALEFSVIGPRDVGDRGRRDGPPGPGGGPASAVRGYCAQVRGTNGTVVAGGCSTRFNGEAAASPPAYPASISLPAAVDATGDRVAYRTVAATRGGGRYRVRVWADDAAPNYTFLLAAPLRNVDSTLHRLLL